MKKILTILATAGLMATTSATVIACTNTVVDTKGSSTRGTIGGEPIIIQLKNWDDIVKNANGKTITLSVEKGLQFVTNSYLKLIDSNDQSKATLDVTTDKDNTGKITLKGLKWGIFKVTIAENKDANLKATIVAVAVDRKDISKGVEAPTITVGESVADAKDAILSAIGVGVTADDVTFSGTAISGDTIVIGGDITVTAKYTSKLIFGEFNITVVSASDENTSK